MKTKFNSDVDLPLSKTPKPHNMVIVVRPVFHERNECYPQVSLDECLHKLAKK